ncbi:hypothetical protein VZT92_015715 [Zoarces viviparus]|uniref:Uncharacterized protein n=1 Tax=Zoarces viviparus TaxID=48416 RepID=A0AAW1EYB1_ZOAVI
MFKKLFMSGAQNLTVIDEMIEMIRNTFIDDVEYNINEVNNLRPDHESSWSGTDVFRWLLRKVIDSNKSRFWTFTRDFVRTHQVQTSDQV